MSNITFDQLAHRFEAATIHYTEETARLLADLGDAKWLHAMTSQENSQLKEELKTLKEELDVLKNKED
jgi:hypothetical protein